MNVVSAVLVLLGTAMLLLASAGLLRFRTPYARFHAAGKASPISFLLVAIGAGIELGWAGAGVLAVAAVALVLTLPAGTHLLFRATHRTGESTHLVVDELAPAEDHDGAADDGAARDGSAGDATSDRTNDAG